MFFLAAYLVSIVDLPPVDYTPCYMETFPEPVVMAQTSQQEYPDFVGEDDLLCRDKVETA